MLTELEIDAFVAQKDDFHLLIDARSPKEYNESHIPHAQNYYALSNLEHEEVGTLYKQVSRNDAKVQGASYICANASRHLTKIYAIFPIGSRIGIYCAKGGLRSSSLALILSAIGYQVFKLVGGYKSYRNYVLSYLETFPHERFMVLGGNTGCGKTELLEQLTPSIDLEGLANHMGSSFGSIKGIQPSQRAFENALCEALRCISPDKTIFIEAESKRMGTITIPTQLHVKMQQSPRIEITAPLDHRIERIVQAYKGMDKRFFNTAMEKISPYIEKKAKEEAIEAFEKGDLACVAKILLVQYYDKVYKKPSAIFAHVEHAITQKTLTILSAFCTN